MSVIDHIWLDPTCDKDGCQSLVWKERAEKAEAENDALRQDAERRLFLLRRLERWCNDRIGDSWQVHDAVNPPLFDAVAQEFKASGGTDAIDAALLAGKG